EASGKDQRSCPCHSRAHERPDSVCKPRVPGNSRRASSYRRTVRGDEQATRSLVADVRKGHMNSIPLSEWRTCFAAVLFEADQTRFKSRIADALRAIDERLKSAEQIGTIERISIESAQRSLAEMEREPLVAPRRRVEKTVTANGKDGPVAEREGTRPGVGSRVRVTLPSGQAVA